MTPFQKFRHAPVRSARAFPPLALALFCALAVPAPAAFASPSAKPAQWTSDGDIVPAAGEYAVLISEKTAAKKAWKAVADKFVKRYAGTLVVWRGNDVSSAKDALKKARARYVAVVASPEEIDRVFIASLHRLSREVDAEGDIYGDFLWGLISGRDAETAGTLLGKDAPLVIDRAIGTTNFDQKRFKKSFFITDWGAREFVETNNYVSSEKTLVGGNADVAVFFAQRWETVDPQLMISSSHATEFNLEMPFGEGLIASAGTDFFIVEKKHMSAFAGTFGQTQKRLDFLKKQNAGTLPKTPAEKIWIAAGNCLIGDALRAQDSMVITALSSANVKQFVGYTVPSWFGEGGWGTCDKFFNGHQTTSVGQAWFFNNQILLNSLPQKVATLALPLTALDMRGANLADAVRQLNAAGVPLSRENIGRFHDRDVVAFYGDPLYRARFNPGAQSVSPWKIELGKTAGDGNALEWKLNTTRAGGFKGDFCLWFPRRIDAKTPLKISSSTRGNVAITPAIFTENFVVFRALELGEKETLTFFAKPKNDE